MAGSSGRRYTGALPVQALLEGRYRIVRLVGKGGFGAVYEARDERFQARMVAIKEMSDARLSPSEKTQAIQNFRQEANLLVPLQHPNLPNVSDFFEEADKAYLVMEFVQGKTLEDVQRAANAPLDEQRVMNWAVQLCDVLGYLHTQPQPIIFRDLKPANIMVTSKEQIKLIDFGIARVFKSTATKDTSSLGSRGYAPLEQYGSGQTDVRSDIYALGATLYDLLTHEVPADAIARRLNPTSFVPPRKLNPRISTAIESIILKAMNEDASMRFQSAMDMYMAIVSSGLVPGMNTGPTVAGSVVPTVGGAIGPTLPPPVAPPPSVQGSQPPASSPKTFSRRNILIAGAALVAAGAGYYVLKGGSGSTTAQIPTINIDFFYSTEKEDWLTEAIDAFHHSNQASYQGKHIRIQPQSGGSGELVQAIQNGETLSQAALSPASTLELDQLIAAWQQKHPTQALLNSERKLLVRSPLVFAVWRDRAQVLLKQYGRIDWDSIAQAIQLPHGWADLPGGKASWQRVKLGQTFPNESNSGLLTITLLAYTFFKGPQSLTLANVKAPAFLNYLDIFERAVHAYGHSSGTYLKQDVLAEGPSSYEIIATYENLALTEQKNAEQSQSQGFHLFYPQYNIESNHPFVLLNGIDPEKLAAAKQFRDFLLQVPMQQLALKYGLRPANPQVHIKDASANNLFVSSDIKSDIQDDSNLSYVNLPGSDVVLELLNQWTTRYPGMPSANG